MTDPGADDIFHTSSLSHHHASSVTDSSSFSSLDLLDRADMASNSIKLLTGNSHPDLAHAVAKRCVLHPSQTTCDYQARSIAIKISR